MLHVPSHLLQAIAWVLIHSLWQGTAAAVLYWLSRRVTRLASVRYLVGHLCLAGLLAAQLLTFALATVPRTTFDHFASRVLPAAQPGLNGRGRIEFRDLPMLSQTMQMLSQIEPALPWLTTLWAAGLAAQIAWMLLLVFSLQSELKKCPEIAEPLRSYLCQLTKRLRHTAGVRFLETAMVSVPATTGWLRPVVLIPVGWILKSPPQQVEAIILHELAHIARRDFATGVLRSFLRVIYFFHVPMRWMMRSLDGDAEQAADHMAATALGDSQAYAVALLSIEVPSSPVRLLLGADGGSLRERFRHLLPRRNRQRQTRSEQPQRRVSRLPLYSCAASPCRL
jgi:beta-lactamase regulating signal transducer with metallopeptidase domain